MRFFIFIAMIFCHIIDDYKLQSPVLTQLKQRAWWEEHEPNELYKHDCSHPVMMPKWLLAQP